MKEFILKNILYVKNKNLSIQPDSIINAYKVFFFQKIENFKAEEDKLTNELVEGVSSFTKYQDN